MSATTIPVIPVLRDAPVVPAGDVLVSKPAAAVLVLLAHAPGRRVPWTVALSLLVRIHTDPDLDARQAITTHLDQARRHHVDDKHIPAHLRHHVARARRHVHGLLRAGWMELTTLDATATVKAIELRSPGVEAYTAITGQPCPQIPADQGVDPEALTAALMGSSIRPVVMAALDDTLTADWQDKEHVLGQVTGLIPVKIGREHMRAKIIRDAKRRGSDPIFPDDMELISRGRRDFAQTILAAMVREGRAERDGTHVRRGITGTTAESA